MARITAQNYQSYMKGSNRHIDTHTREMYLGDSPTVQAGYGTYDSKSTAHKVACYMFSLNDSATENTPCEDIPRGFTVAVEENSTVVEYQYKKPMPSDGYTAADLEVKSIANVDASDVSYGNSNVGTALLGIEKNVHTLRDDVGVISGLETTYKQDLVGAVNEVNANADSANNKIGTLTYLHTTNKDTVVDAINEVNDAIPTSMSAENVTYSSSGSHTVGSIAEAIATEITRAQTAETDRYTKSETYTKEEVHNLITTPNQEYVSVTATALTTAVTDVLPVTGAADTTYRVGNWDGTQYNDFVFSEYAWNGSAYIKLSTKSQIGEVYDISANHADTTYADLATALGTNGANIPSTIRKGGMSIKFVNSNTHKYEQWSLKASSWSANTSDWGNTNVTKASEVGYREGNVADKLDRTMDKSSNVAVLSDNTNTLYITDLAGNVLAKFDSDGLHCAKFLAHNGNEIINLLSEINKAVKFTAQSLTNAQKTQACSNIGAITLDDIPISEGFAGGLAIADVNGNIIAKADAAGMHCSHFIVHVGNATYDLYPLIQALQAKKSVLYSAQTLTDAEKEQARQNIGVKISDSVSDDLEGVLYILDSNQYAIAKFDKDGLHINNLVSNKDKVVVCDAAGYIAFRIKSNGFVDLNISAESFRKAFDEMLGGGGTSDDFEVDAPEELFRVTNDIYPSREYAPCLFAERMQVDDKNIAFSDGSYCWYVANKVLTTPNTPYVTNTISKRVYKDMFSSKEISFKLETTKASVFEGKLLNFMPIGDSITDQNNWHTYLRKLLVMDNIDWQIKNSSSVDSIKMQTLGIKRSTSNVNISYRNKTVNLQYNYNEGRSSWAAATYLRHAERYTFDTVSYNGNSVPILHVAWRVLGLYEKYGTEYNWGAEHKELIRTTCNGQYPITTACINGYVWNKYRDKISLGSVDYTNATAQQKEDMITYLTTTMLDNPDNPFFSKEKVLATKDTDNCYAFDWDTYYARYKTHNEAGEELEVKGSKATTAMHVCIPNVVGICLGTNDSVWSSSDTLINMQDAYQIATLMQEATNAVVIIFANGVPQSIHIDTYTLAGKDRIIDDYYRPKNKKLQSLCGDFANQTEKNIFYCPCYYVQSYGNYNDRPLIELYTENQIGSVLTVGDIHPDNRATAQWSYQIYSLMAYLIAKNIL